MIGILLTEEEYKKYKNAHDRLKKVTNIFVDKYLECDEKDYRKITRSEKEKDLETLITILEEILNGNNLYKYQALIDMRL